MAREPERFLRPVPKTAEDYSCENGIFGLLGHSRALDEYLCEDGQSLKDHRTAI